ncbi:trichohyalin [Drosophila tropicalis]|uniref:trichohyalin n=1 Tax=Drosophila tropicalis TaxID=46794 RepID=UPI0035AB87D0
MQYSWLPQERRQIIIREKPPVIISQKRFSRIQTNATQASKIEKQLRNEQRNQYEEQLRLGGEELLRQFGGRKLCITEEEECVRELSQQQKHKEEAARQSLEDSKAARDEEQRRQRERIAKAQQLLEQLRPGPRELQCARLQSEVLGSINAQREVQMEFAKAKQLATERDKCIFQEQVINGIKEAQKNRSERCQQLGEHKMELLKAIAEREKGRKLAKAEEMATARQEREKNQQQLKEHLTKMKETQTAKRHQRREEALASLAMSEQVQQRLQMLDEVEDTQCEVHNQAKGQLEQLKRDHARNRIEQRLRRNDQLAQNLAPRLHYSAGQDHARYERQLEEMRKAHSAEQAKRQQLRQAAKTQRLNIQKQEKELVKASKQQAAQERQQAIELRLKNDLIQVQFKREQHQEHLRRMHELRQQLDKQVQQRHEEETRPGRNYNREAQLECLREDVFFFDYARQLMDEAQAKGHPLKPFIRAVGQYKNDNRIGAGIRIPPHLVTRLTMGRRTEGDSQAEKQPSETNEKEKTMSQEEAEHKKKITEDLKKIEDFILAEAKLKEKK